MTMKVDLSGHVALVTGAGRNIGKAIALAIGESGAAVACIYNEAAQKAQETADEIVAKGGRAKPFKMNVVDVPLIRPAIVRIQEELGVVDIVVNCAAIRPRRKIAEVTLEEWDLVIGTNLRGHFFVDQAAIPGMKAKGWGRIIHIGGVDANWGNAQRPHVVATKLGTVGLARSLANETGRWGITVNTVVPGVIDTNRPHPEWYPEQQKLYEERLARIPEGRLGKISDLSNAVLFLASDAAGYITGQELIVAGGAPLVRLPGADYD